MQANQLMDSNLFQSSIRKVAGSYRRRKQQEEEVWRGYKDELVPLIHYVGSGFEATLKKIGPLRNTSRQERWSPYAKIYPTGFSTSFLPDEGMFRINVNSVVNSKGEDKCGSMSRGDCRYAFLNGIVDADENSRTFGGPNKKEIAEFKRDFRVKVILGTQCTCP